MKIISDTSMLVICSDGTTWGLNPGTPTELPTDLAVQTALTKGARVYKGEIDDVEEAVFEEVVIAEPEPESGPDAELVTALERLIDEGDPNNFKTNGAPKAAVVNALLGRSVSATERDEAWEAVLNS